MPASHTQIVVADPPVPAPEPPAPKPAADKTTDKKKEGSA